MSKSLSVRSNSIVEVVDVVEEVELVEVVGVIVVVVPGFQRAAVEAKTNWQVKVATIRSPLEQF